VATKKFVYFFGNGKAEGKSGMKDLLGGKGAGLAEMTNLKVPVPAGFTISTEACVAFFKNKKKSPPGLWEEVRRYMKRLESVMGAKFGDPARPLLVSVRSGARASMPGMMDTVLNLGLNERTVQGLIKKTKNERFAYDAYRRFITMFSTVVMDIKRERFEDALKDKKTETHVVHDTDLTAAALKDLVARFKKIVKEDTGRDFPEDPYDQLKMGIDAVFNSWYGARAVTYRRLYDIPDDWGTAVNVVAMVFGNMGDTSGTGVAFTRDPSTGNPKFFGECLLNAQGEDVVAGIRTPLPIEALAKPLPKAYQDLMATYKKLERHYRDMLDLEFTIQEGKLYMLQTRVGKRTGIAAVRIAVDLVKEGVIDKREAVMRVGPEQLAQYLYPIFDPKQESQHQAVGKGLPAGPGAAAGKIALTPERAVEMKERGERALLVRRETSPDDIHGMSASVGFLTAKGGMTSHAAVVARQMGKVCVAGCEALDVGHDGVVRFGSTTLKEGDALSINGFTGAVYAGEIPVVESEIIQVIQGHLKPEQSEKYRYFSMLLKWADEFRTLGVRANADVPDQAIIARGFGAAGIGLCRTEHMFFAEDRVPIMQRMILAKTREDRERELTKLLPLQKSDFIGLYRAMKGHPVTIRLLDPPLHEFLPKREDLMVEIARMELNRADAASIETKKKLLARIEELHEFNPMLGLRGCRLGITMPEITRMQVQAIMEAACEVTREGIRVVPEIMIPLVGLAAEMKAQKDLVREVAADTMRRCRTKFPYLVGTMIELPRAAITADKIALEADFFSFGTNDLTQTTFGFSRDDAAKFTDFYMNRRDRCPRCRSREVDQKTMKCRACGLQLSETPDNILDADPFATLDQEGVGGLMRLAIERGRSVKPDLKLGICGEHGGDPASVAFCHDLGLDYVSCSPYRVPIARLAAAQAAIKTAESGSAVKRRPARRSRPASRRRTRR
jgi:pyruvate,orthophosphate dikinase